MFYFEQDRREIRGWLKTADDKVREELREEIQTQIRKQQGNFITNQQLAQYDVENKIWVTDKVDAVRKAFDTFVADDFDRLKNSADATAQEVKALKSAVNNVPAVDALKDEIAALKDEVDKLKAAIAPPEPEPPIDDDALTKKVADLSAENDALKKQLAQHDQNFAVVTKALNDIQKNFFGLLQQRDAQILSLKTEVDALKAEVNELKTEVDELKAAIAPPEPEPQGDDDDKFFLLAQSDEYLPADRRQIPAKIKAALDMHELEQFLTEHPSTTSTQFQKILNNHAKEVKKFVDKLKLNDLDDEELSETVTAKYFKLFQRTIFDNLLIAIRRGFKASDKSANAFYSEFLKGVKKFVDKLKLNDIDDEELSETVAAKYFKLFQRTIFDNLLIAIRRGFKASDKSANAFYSEFLALLNQYLMRCGIYSLNVTKGRKADSHDYENMTPQVIKTADETLAGMIDSIERLPYRINYRDEFGEQKFFQYAGIMNVYKAV